MFTRIITRTAAPAIAAAVMAGSAASAGASVAHFPAQPWLRAYTFAYGTDGGACLAVGAAGHTARGLICRDGTVIAHLSAGQRDGIRHRITEMPRWARWWGSGRSATGVVLGGGDPRTCQTIAVFRGGQVRRAR